MAGSVLSGNQSWALGISLRIKNLDAEDGWIFGLVIP